MHNSASMLHIIWTKSQVIVEVINEHHANNHQEDYSMCSKHEDREANFRAIKQNPTATAKQI